MCRRFHGCVTNSAPLLIMRGLLAVLNRVSMPKVPPFASLIEVPFVWPDKDS